MDTGNLWRSNSPTGQTRRGPVAAGIYAVCEGARLIYYGM